MKLWGWFRIVKLSGCSQYEFMSNILLGKWLGKKTIDIMLNFNTDTNAVLAANSRFRLITLLSPEGISCLLYSSRAFKALLDTSLLRVSRIFQRSWLCSYNNIIILEPRTMVLLRSLRKDFFYCCNYCLAYSKVFFFLGFLFCLLGSFSIVGILPFDSAIRMRMITTTQNGC